MPLTVNDRFRTAIGALSDNWTKWHADRGATGASSWLRFYRNASGVTTGTLGDAMAAYWAAPPARTTATGTAGGQAVRLEGPSHLASAPLIVWCHESGGSQNSPWSNAFSASLVSALVDSGWIIASSNMGGATTWGNAAATNSIAPLIAWVETTWTVTDIVLVGQSMGGIAALNYIGLGGYDSRVRGFVGTAGAASLAAMWAQAGFKADIRTAYGFVDDGDYATATSGRDPMLRTASAFNGLRYRWFTSPGDTAVTKVDHADPMSARVTGALERQVVVAGSGGHFDPTSYGWFLESDWSQFLNRCRGYVG